MVIFKITLLLFGDDFFPDNVADKIASDSLLVESSQPGDEIWPGSNTSSDDGMLSIIHPRIFGTQHDEWAYEKWYVEFIERNHKLFIENGVDDFQFFVDVFYSGNQCNIEVFNKDLLKRLNDRIRFSIPLSVYRLTQKEIREMLLEAGYSQEEIKTFD